MVEDSGLKLVEIGRMAIINLVEIGKTTEINLVENGKITGINLVERDFNCNFAYKSIS